jgi:thymidylate kinase
MMQERKKRGLLIVIEGVDKIGKTTQCGLIYDYFSNTRMQNTEIYTFDGI